VGGGWLGVPGTYSNFPAKRSIDVGAELFAAWAACVPRSRTLWSEKLTIAVFLPPLGRQWAGMFAITGGAYAIFVKVTLLLVVR